MIWGNNGIPQKCFGGMTSFPLDYTTACEPLGGILPNSKFGARSDKDEFDSNLRSKGQGHNQSRCGQ